MKKDMYRFLEKYVGTYRVKAEYDLSTGDFPRNENGGIDESFDDLYIPCAKGRIQHTYQPYMLVWYTDSLGQGRNLKREIDEKYKDKFEYTYEETGGDVLIYFKDEDIKKIAALVKPRTSGASIKPFASANLPKGDFIIPEADVAAFQAIYKDLSTADKMQFARVVIKDFDSVIQKKKGKKILEARKESGLKPKEYIHFIGMWNDFIKFAKKEYDEKY